MSGAKCEFIVDGSVAGEPGKLTVVGRCGEVEIPLGTSFRLLYSVKSRDYPHGLERPAERDTERAVDLTVEAISAYGKDRDRLPAGTTGCLTLNSASQDLLPCGWVLEAA